MFTTNFVKIVNLISVPALNLKGYINQIYEFYNNDKTEFSLLNAAIFISIQRFLLYEYAAKLMENMSIIEK